MVLEDVPSKHITEFPVRNVLNPLLARDPCRDAVVGPIYLNTPRVKTKIPPQKCRLNGTWHLVPVKLLCMAVSGWMV